MYSRRPAQLAIIVVVLSWFCAVAWLGASGFFVSVNRVFGLSPVQLAIFLPLVAFWFLYLLFPSFADFARTADITFLVALQVVRILALSHIVCWGYGLMAGGFAIPVGLGNLLVCSLALSSIAAVSERREHWVTRVYILTAIGIAEFAMTISLAVLGIFNAPLPFDPPTAAGGYITFATPPLSLFPTFAIPALTLAHFVTIVAVRHQSMVVHQGAGVRHTMRGVQAGA